MTQTILSRRQFLAPTDGSNASGTSDYYWQFVTIFPSVVEAMMPSTAGTSCLLLQNSTQTDNRAGQRITLLRSLKQNFMSITVVQV